MYRPVKKKVQGWTNAGVAVVALLTAVGLGQYALHDTSSHTSSALSSTTNATSSITAKSSASSSSTSTPSFHVVGSTHHEDGSSHEGE